MIKNSGYNLRFSLLFGGHLCIIKQRFLERSIERNRNMSASVRSMTGYGRGEHIAEERKFTVEMKSVNHRYNDMTIKLPRSLAGLEDKIKKRIMHEVFRGKTDVYISFETFSAADVEVKLNEALAAAYIEKLNNRLKDLLGGVDVDPQRIATEVAVFADRGCVDEEVTRLESHLIQLKDILDGGGQVGRKLDFLIQEMNRESNTIASKANDIQIVKATIELKSEIEKIREQIQNLE